MLPYFLAHSQSPDQTTTSGIQRSAFPIPHLPGVCLPSPPSMAAGRDVLCSRPPCGHFPLLPNSEPSHPTPFQDSRWPGQKKESLFLSSSPEAPSQVQPLTTSTQWPPLIDLIYSAEQHFVIADNAAFPAPLPFTTAWHKAPGS